MGINQAFWDGVMLGMICGLFLSSAGGFVFVNLFRDSKRGQGSDSADEA